MTTKAFLDVRQTRWGSVSGPITDRNRRRSLPGTLLIGRHDASLRGEDGAVPVTEGHPLHLQLSGLGVDVQTCGGGAVRHRRATGLSAGVALHAPQRRFAGLDREAGSDLAKKHRPAGVKVLASDDLSEMFGIEMAPAMPPKCAAVSTVATKPSTAASSKASSRQTKISRPAKLREPTPKRRDGKQRRIPARRRAISERMRKYWAARRGLAKKQMASKSSYRAIA
jgi:hypothetical protein